MKKLFLAAIAFSAVSYASAQATEAKATGQVAVAADGQQQGTVVKLEDLPEAVKKTLASDTYAGWKPVSAVWIDGKMAHYEIQLMRGEEQNVAKLSKEGKPIV